MLFHAKNHTLVIGDTRMDYVSCGKGDRRLVMIPGHVYEPTRYPVSFEPACRSPKYWS